MCSPWSVDDHNHWDDWDKETGLQADWQIKIASAAMAARERGKLPAYLQDLVNGFLSPKLSWRAILRDKVMSTTKNNFRWIPPNKKYLHRNLILPGISGDEIKIAVAVDTSGSISSQTLAEFLAEIDGICATCDTFTLHLYAADARIQKYWELHEMDPVPKQMPGRGGTNFCPVIEDLGNGRKDFSVLVYLTDLDGHFPDKAPDFPVIWVSTTDPARMQVPFGEVIFLSRENSVPIK
jgi:predicted metal-dependent peptidase